MFYCFICHTDYSSATTRETQNFQRMFLLRNSYRWRTGTGDTATTAAVRLLSFVFFGKRFVHVCSTLRLKQQPRNNMGRSIIAIRSPSRFQVLLVEIPSHKTRFNYNKRLWLIITWSPPPPSPSRNICSTTKTLLACMYTYIYIIQIHTHILCTSCVVFITRRCSNTRRGGGGEVYGVVETVVALCVYIYIYIKWRCGGGLRAHP